MKANVIIINIITIIINLETNPSIFRVYFSLPQHYFRPNDLVNKLLVRNDYYTPTLNIRIWIHFFIICG